MSKARGIDRDCRFCRWWGIAPANPGVSDLTHREGAPTHWRAPCQRHAPRAPDPPQQSLGQAGGLGGIAGMMGMVPVWPFVGADEGCGDFERFRT